MMSKQIGTYLVTKIYIKQKPQCLTRSKIIEIEYWKNYI